MIGRQVYTDFGKYIDLLAIDTTGSIIIIELKKHKTPRDVVAQTIDYAAWVENLSSEKFVQIYADFSARYAQSEQTFIGRRWIPILRAMISHGATSLGLRYVATANTRAMERSSKRHR